MPCRTVGAQFIAPELLGQMAPGPDESRPYEQEGPSPAGKI